VEAARERAAAEDAALEGRGDDMPAALVKSFAKKAGKTTKAVEKLWRKAKAQAKKQKRGGDYNYVVGILKRMLKIEQGTVEDFFREQEIALTDDELQKMLDAKIRERARWRFKDPQNAENEVETIAKEIYDDIIADFSFNDQVVKATRAVKKFNQAYVRRVISKALKAGDFDKHFLSMSSEVASAVGMIALGNG